MLAARGVRCAINAGRRISVLYGVGRNSPHFTGLSASGTTTFKPLQSSFCPSSRFFSETSSPAPLETPNEPRKRRYNKTKKNKTRKERNGNSTRVGEDVQMALETLEVVKNSDSAKMTEYVATTLLVTLTKEKKLEKAMEVLELASKQEVALSTQPYQDLIMALYRAKDCTTALRVYDIMCNDNKAPSTLVYTTALLAAHTAAQHDLIPEILTRMIKDAKPDENQAFQSALRAALLSKQLQLVLDIASCAEVLGIKLTAEHYHVVLMSYTSAGNLQAALNTRDTLQEHGFALTDAGLYWLVHCASRLDKWELVQELLAPKTPNSEHSDGVQVTANTYSAAIGAYANNDHWTKVVNVYEMMPDNLRSELPGRYLSSVIMAHAKSESKEIKLQALKILNHNKTKANTRAYSAVAKALVETEQFDEALTIVEAMQTHHSDSGGSAYRGVVLALIRRGTAEEAKRLLEGSVKRMGDSPTGYLEIIRFYAEKNATSPRMRSRHERLTGRMVSGTATSRPFDITKQSS